MRIGCANDFAEEEKRWAGQAVFFQDRIERNVFAVVTEFAIRNVENDRIRDLGPIGAMGEENKFRLAVDEVTDQPGTGDTVDFDFFASNPFHQSDDLIGMDSRQSIHICLQESVSSRSALKPAQKGTRSR